MMKTRKNSIFFLRRLFVCIVLIAATALCITGCTKQNSTSAAPSLPSEPVLIGNGSRQFLFTARAADGTVIGCYEVHTDSTTVGDALQENGLIKGDAGAYGLYVKEVCGVTADYDKDRTYWSFLIGGEYAVNGVDMTEIMEGTAYEFRIAK